MPNVVKGKGLIGFHPGYYLEEYIDAENLTAKEFAEVIGINEERFKDVLNGDICLDYDLIKKIAAATGTSEIFWERLNKEFYKKVELIL